MADGTGENANYDAQFADLMGNMGDNDTTGPLLINTDVELDRESTLTQDSDSSSAAQAGTTQLMKGVDVMKARYQGKEEMQKIPLRRPKKLDRPWGKQQSEESGPSDRKDGTSLPREQDLVPYTTLGTDYGRKQYENKVEKEKAHKDGQLSPIPVNRQVVEKVAPPEITKNVRHMFETGQLTDLHPTKKTQVEEPTPESGVFENKPVELEGVVRSSDFNMEGEELQKGFTQNLVDDWKSKGKDDSPKELKQINVAEDEGRTLENEPDVRTDVIRESDIHPSDELTIERGHAKNLKEKFLKPQEDKKEKKIIKLVENEGEVTVFENTPQALEGVVRSCDYSEDTQFQKGNAKNLKGYWSTRTDEVQVEKEKIQIDRDGSGPTVLESQPEVLEGVVRESDAPQDEKDVNLKSGHTKNIATMWQRRSAEDGPKAPKQPIKMDLADSGPTVLENNPVELEGVVKCDTVVEDVIPGNRGRTKDIAGKFLQEEVRDDRPREMIQIERSEGPTVLENEPELPAEGIVRSDSYAPDNVLEAGRTKNLLSHWNTKEHDNLTPKTSQSSVNGKPSWIKEIEAARDSGVFENEPEVNEAVVKESDIPECEKEECIPTDYAKNLKKMWLLKAEEEERIKRKETLPELVRFTPPREITPPPVNQQEYQSTQSITLAPKVNGHMEHENGPEMLHTQHPVQQQQDHYVQQDHSQSQHEVQHAYQNGDVPEPMYNSPPPVQTVKSSTIRHKNLEVLHQSVGLLQMTNQQSSETDESAPKLEDTLADYQPPKRYSKKEEKGDVGPSVYITPTDSQEKKPAPKMNVGGAGANNMCKRCNKRVYEMEKMIADKDIYHKLCFRCTHCKRILSLGNFAAIDGAPYCKPHFIELFKKKGRYDMNTAKPRSDVESPVNTQEVVNGSNYEEEDDKEDDEEPMKEIQKEEPVRCHQMSSVRNMFETASRNSSPARVTTPKLQSKWDKPAETQPTAKPTQQDLPQQETQQQTQQEQEEQENVDDLPPPAITRNLVARFREMEQSGGEIYVPDRKPIHKITPPRDELAIAIEEARVLHEQQQLEPQHHLSQQQNDEEEYERARSQPEIIKSGEEPNPASELPPPQFTRQMLAKFKSMEEIHQLPSNTSNTPPKISAVQRSTSLRSTPPNPHNVRQLSRASPDSGIMELDMQPVNGRAHVESEHEEEKELPEEGFTKSLVAKWRNLEEYSPSAPGPVTKSTTLKQPTYTLPAQDHVDYSQSAQYVAEETDQHSIHNGREVVREGDTSEEDFLPQPSFTKNMLAKFQTLEAQAERQAQDQSHPTKKHFKWLVKEAPLISGSGMVWQEKRHSTSGDLDLQDDHYNHDDEIEYENEDHYQNVSEHMYEQQDYITEDDSGSDHNAHSVHYDDELPPQPYAKSMLEKFRSLEQAEQPPPSPERAEQQQKMAVIMRQRLVSSEQNVTSIKRNSWEQSYEQHSSDENLHGEDYQEQESDHQEDELPEIGTTRNLLSKFQVMAQ